MGPTSDYRLAKVLSLACCLGAFAALSAGCCAFFIFPENGQTQTAFVIATDRYQLYRGQGAASQASMRVVHLGGTAPYTYQWSVTDPAGNAAGGLLDSQDTSSVRFTAGEVDGPYHVRCTVADATGLLDTASIVLQVGGTVGLDITTERLGVIAGGGALGRTTIRLQPQSGRPPFDVTWICTGPDGKIDNDRLDLTDPLAPVFTSGNQVGNFICTATVVDANGTTSVESVIVIVGQILGLDVIAGRASVLPGGGPEGLVTLLATPIGGTAPYEYDWEVIGPSGQNATGLLWATDARSPIFESSELTGTFLARCSVTDAEGTVLIGSTTISVGQQISVDVTTDRLALALSGGIGGRAALTADVRGGRDPVAVEWQAIGPGGVDASSLLAATNALSTTFISSDQPGSYVVRCTVTDADNVSSADSLVLTVGGTLGASVAAERTSLATGGIAPSGTTLLSAQVYGGEPPYTYQWSVIDPTGASDLGRLNSTAIASPTFSSAAQVGSYSVSCAVTDATGATAVDTLRISVGQPLNVDVTVDKQSLLSGGGVSGQAQLITTINGGSSPYTYQWAVIAPNNAPDPSRLTATNVANPVFTSTALTGTYRLTLTTTDALGAVFVESVEVVVSDPPVQALSADVVTDRFPVPSGGGTTQLVVTATGGAPPLSYAWAVTDPSGATDNARLDSTTNTIVTFTSAATLGTYRIRCTVTDSASNTFTDSVQLTVSDSFSLNVTAAVSNIAPGGTVNLFADRTGGAANFSYVWSCVDEVGAAAGAFTTGSTGAGGASQVAADDATNGWTAPSAGPGSLGTYRIQVTMTDALGNTATDSVQVVVQLPLTLSVSANSILVEPYAAITFNADQTGGETPFTYTWEAVDSTGNPAGTFTTGAGSTGTATQAGQAGDVTNEWSTSEEDTYTIACTVSDNVGQVFTDSVSVVVRAKTIMQSTFLAPAAPDLVGVLGITTLTGASLGADPGQQILSASLNDPDYPRNIVITITDADNSITGGTARVTGIDVWGNVRTEVFNIPASAALPPPGSSTNVGAIPFASVRQVDLYDFNGVDTFFGLDKITIGLGSKFGLTGTFDVPGDVLYINEGGTVVTAGYTVDVTPGEQGVTFATPPDGATDYVVVYRAR
ncbi:MAG: hypothetical protein JXQ73_13875 [Phycisphaerae bacterium]|nr:hypothetical protein [Phycisphaerae bacterium]